MMEGVIDCIKNGKHGLIESPTGTGKTLSIICAAVAAVAKTRQQYVAAEKEKLNSQLKQKVHSSPDSTVGDETLSNSEEKNIV